MTALLINPAYLLASILFIFGLKGLTHPRTAVRGNLLAAMGMMIAVVVTLLHNRVVRLEIVFAAIVIGSALGTGLAVKIKMTAMPQLVALFNALGGGASALVAGAALTEHGLGTGVPPLQLAAAGVASGTIGAVTFWGSLAAFGKLQGLVSEKAVRFTGRYVLNAIVVLSILGIGALLVANPAETRLYWALLGTASVLGVLLVVPIGGADMPVVIALLNAYSGLAAAATGFVLSNNILIIAGSLVGASGIILTRIMCRAMNRSLANVLFGGLGTVEEQETGGDDEFYGGRVKATSAEEVAMLLDGARRVVIVPGYGMAVSQAQHAVRDLAGLLESRGAEVVFAIHPVAGRMPGHMNVLLAEADISYDKLKEMEAINPDFPQTDVVLVVGANDVVNPAARTDSSNPIAGMPILDVDKARTVVVVKRSLSPGFAGIPNPLFAAEKTLMLFGDGKKALLELISAVKES